MENENYILSCKLDEAMQSIKDIDNFKFRLTLDGLSTPELEDFIENYIKYYNI